MLFALAVAVAGCGDGRPVSLKVDPDSGLDRGDDGGPAALDAGGEVGVDAGLSADAAQTLDGGPAGSGFGLLLLDLETGALDHPVYPRAVRSAAYEAFLARRVAQLRPDVVVVLGTVSSVDCAVIDEMDARRPCYQADERPSQAQRLLGGAYTVVCDALAETGSGGVRSTFARVDGVEPGAQSTEAGHTANLPGPACEYATGACGEESCDERSGVLALDLLALRGSLRLIAIDANGSGVDMGGAFYLGTRCRASQVAQAFGYAEEGPTLLVGDWAFEPGEMFQEAETAIWASNVGADARFWDHDAREGGGGRVPTRESPPRALAHVVSDFAEGECEVLSMPAIDNGFVFDPPEEESGRLLGFAVHCTLGWPRP